MIKLDANQNILLKHGIAEHYHYDGRLFLRRFSTLWNMSGFEYKEARIKTFVDLIMAIECYLKAQIFFESTTNSDVSAEEVYKKVRDHSHSIPKLISATSTHLDPEYQKISKELINISVFIRYSLDADASMFQVSQNENQLYYSNRLGNEAWMQDILNFITKIQSILDPYLPKSATVENFIKQSLVEEFALSLKNKI